MSPRYIGIDVGGTRKGFHGCALEGSAVVEGPLRLPTPEEVATWAADQRPAVVAVDSPCTLAPPEATSREGELALNKEVCGIRWTPEHKRLEGNPYYEWIIRGLELYSALQDKVGAETKIIEVFPTASWTVWVGERNSRSRAAWTNKALSSLGIEHLPSRRLNQDDRDAVAAAVTARQYDEGRTRDFKPIVVPTERSPWMKP
ncbi:MAG: DUF429 domain-containing protein [Actinomycetota bacterium]|nr:DUF429 domain-containing protein [Actinomycetota bacterium]